MRPETTPPHERRDARGPEGRAGRLLRLAAVLAAFAAGVVVVVESVLRPALGAFLRLTGTPGAWLLLALGIGCFIIGLVRAARA